MAEAAGSVFGPINAEVGDTTEITVSVEADNAVTADVDAKLHGNYGFKCVWGGTTNDLCAGYVSFSDQTEMYARVYFYIETWMFTTATRSTHLMSLRDGTTPAIYIQAVENASGIGFRSWLNNGVDILINLSTEDVISEDALHYVDAYWKAGTPGAAEVWLDGVSKGSTAIINMSQPHVSRCYFGGTGSAPDNPGVIYFDDMIGSTAGPIGTYAEAGGSIVPQAMHHYKLQRRVF